MAKLIYNGEELPLGGGGGISESHADQRYLKLTGGRITGDLELGESENTGGPCASLYVSSYSGDEDRLSIVMQDYPVMETVMTANGDPHVYVNSPIMMNNDRITNLGDPQDDNDAVTKRYADDIKERFTLPATYWSTGLGGSYAFPVPTPQGLAYIIPFSVPFRYNTGDSTSLLRITTNSLQVPYDKKVFCIINRVHVNYSNDNTEIYPYYYKQIFGNYTDLNTLATCTIGNSIYGGQITITVRNLISDYIDKPYRIYGTCMITPQNFMWKEYGSGSDVLDPYPDDAFIVL